MPWWVRGLVWMGLLGLLGLLTIHPSATAQADPPGRVGRLALLDGRVSVFDDEAGQWSAATRNRPLTHGDRVATENDARAELRVGSTVLRLDGGSELEVLRLDDERLEFQLHAGSLALRLRSREVAAETTVVTQEARLRPLRSGRYRIDRRDDTTYAGSALGELQVEGDDGFVIDTNRRAELWREGAQRALRHAWTGTVDDAFTEWVARADRDDERSASARYVSPEMTGVEELDRHGRWDQHPEYGAVWLPVAVAPGWAPYRQGRWAWMRPWGWTWVDDAPWGFAPFHYGRWLHWGGRWGWAPGAYIARPVFAPALVAWVGGPRLSVSVSIGGAPYPVVGWVPLAPRDVYMPYYAASPRHWHHVNPLPRPLPPGHVRPPLQRPSGPVMYGNQQVPGAVTFVPGDHLVPHRPVVPVVAGRPVDGPDAWVGRPWTPGVAAPPRPPRPGPGSPTAPHGSGGVGPGLGRGSTPGGTLVPVIEGGPPRPLRPVPGQSARPPRVDDGGNGAMPAAPRPRREGVAPGARPGPRAGAGAGAGAGADPAPGTTAGAPPAPRAARPDRGAPGTSLPDATVPATPQRGPAPAAQPEAPAARPDRAPRAQPGERSDRNGRDDERGRSGGQRVATRER